MRLHASGSHPFGVSGGRSRASSTTEPQVGECPERPEERVGDTCEGQCADQEHHAAKANVRKRRRAEAGYGIKRGANAAKQEHRAEQADDDRDARSQGESKVDEPGQQTLAEVRARHAPTRSQRRDGSNVFNRDRTLRKRDDDAQRQPDGQDDHAWRISVPNSIMVQMNTENVQREVALGKRQVTTSAG